MTKITRRRFLKVGAVGLSLVATGRSASGEGSGFGSLDFLGLKQIGSVQSRKSVSIAESSLSVGFEVLDRQCFDPTRTYKHLAELGVKWARCQTGWCRCEKERGKYDFAWLDEVVDSLLSIGVQPWFNLGYGNKLYTPDAPDENAVGWAPVYDDSAFQAWLRFVQALAEHFSSRVKHWEIWNEPNAQSFWKPKKGDVEGYVKLVAQTAPVIRKAVPGVTIIGIACGGINMDYINACLEGGICDYIDVVSYHPYRATPEDGYEKEIVQLREAIAAHRKGIELWQGENGCPSKGGPESAGALSELDWNETAQAKWLLRRILTDLRLDIRLTSYFHTVDLLNYRGKTNFKGLLRGTDYSLKPAYYAYQCLCSLFDKKTQHVPLTTELVGQEKVHLQESMFVRNGSAMYAYWYPADLLKPWDARKISVRLGFPEGTKISEPILIDSLDGKAYALGGIAVDAKGFTANDLPLLDYPVILTDRSVLNADADGSISGRSA